MAAGLARPLFRNAILATHPGVSEGARKTAREYDFERDRYQGIGRCETGRPGTLEMHTDFAISTGSQTTCNGMSVFVRETVRGFDQH